MVEATDETTQVSLEGDYEKLERAEVGFAALRMERGLSRGPYPPNHIMAFIPMTEEEKQALGGPGVALGTIHTWAIRIAPEESKENEETRLRFLPHCEKAKDAVVGYVVTRMKRHLLCFSNHIMVFIPMTEEEQQVLRGPGVALGTVRTWVIRIAPLEVDCSECFALREMLERIEAKASRKE